MVIVGHFRLFQAIAGVFPSTFYGVLEFFPMMFFRESAPPSRARLDSRHCSRPLPMETDLDTVDIQEATDEEEVIE